MRRENLAGVVSLGAVPERLGVSEPQGCEHSSPPHPHCFSFHAAPFSSFQKIYGCPQFPNDPCHKRVSRTPRYLDQSYGKPCRCIFIKE